MSFEPVEHGDISRIVGRCHVGDSPLKVVRYMTEQFNGERAGWLKNRKAARRYSIAAALQHHAENMVEYQQVMNRSGKECFPRYWFEKATDTTEIRP